MVYPTLWLLGLLVFVANSACYAQTPYVPTPAEFGPLGASPAEIEARLATLKAAADLYIGTTFPPGQAPSRGAALRAAALREKIANGGVFGCTTKAGVLMASWPDSQISDGQKECKFWTPGVCKKIGVNCGKFDAGGNWCPEVPALKPRAQVILAGIIANEMYHWFYDEEKSERPVGGTQFKFTDVCKKNFGEYGSTWAEYCTLVKLRALAPNDKHLLDLLDSLFKHLENHHGGLRLRCPDQVPTSPFPLPPVKKH